MPALGYSKTFTYLMVAALAWSAWALVRSPPPLFHALFLFALCLVATDLISGILHVILDNPRSLEIPQIRGLAEGFQRHHETPSRIYEMPLYEHLYVMHMPLTFLFGAVLAVRDGRTYVVFVSMVIALHLMQMAHLWAHLPPDRVPRTVRVLQRTGVLLSKPQHDQHHVDPYDRDFCIMTGWCNRPLNAVVNVVGRTSHVWIGIFLLAAVTPVAIAVGMRFVR